jgi:hypothetical protein
MRKSLARLAVVVLLVLAVTAGVGQIYAKKPNPWTGPCPKPAPDCFCILIYAPVICNGDCVYSNSCFAACAGAKGCKPLYPVIDPLPL